MAEAVVDDAAVGRFVQMAGCDAQQARFMLEACNNNADAALQMYFGAW